MDRSFSVTGEFASPIAFAPLVSPSQRPKVDRQEILAVPQLVAKRRRPRPSKRTAPAPTSAAAKQAHASTSEGLSLPPKAATPASSESSSHGYGFSDAHEEQGQLGADGRVGQLAAAAVVAASGKRIDGKDDNPEQLLRRGAAQEILIIGPWFRRLAGLSLLANVVFLFVALCIAAWFKAPSPEARVSVREIGGNTDVVYPFSSNEVRAWTTFGNVESHNNEAAFHSFEDALEGVAGLMRRLGRLRPHLGRLTKIGSVNALGGPEEEARRLDERFGRLLDSMRAVSSDGTANVFTAAKENGLLAFHKDLALFVGSIEVELELNEASTTLQQPAAPRQVESRAAAASSQLSFGGVASETETTTRAKRGRRKTTTTTTSVAELSERLDNALLRIVRGAQKITALRVQLRGSEPSVVAAQQKVQQLDAALLTLQTRGSELEGDGSRPTPAAEGARYAAELEAYVQVQVEFIKELEAMV